MIPPPYPRIALLAANRQADPDDLVLSAGLVAAASHRHFTVEEKLDGFNVSLALDANGWPEVYARSGKTHGDRGGQLGRVRAWTGAHAEGLTAILQRWPVLYGEWMMLRHTVAYDQLPDWLIVLDLWHPRRGFASPAERDTLCDALGLQHVPQLAVGPWPSEAQMVAWCTHSRFSSGRAEGLVLRDKAAPASGAYGKWLAPWFRRRSDAEWTVEQNALAVSE